MQYVAEGYDQLRKFACCSLSDFGIPNPECDRYKTRFEIFLREKNKEIYRCGAIIRRDDKIVEMWCNKATPLDKFPTENIDEHWYGTYMRHGKRFKLI